MTYVLALPSSIFANNNCSPILSASITGMSSTVMRNALARTPARYSRRAMTRILCTGGLLGRRRDADKDVVQGRLRLLEQAHRATLHHFGQDALRIGAALQAQLLVVAEIRHTGHARQAGQGRVAVQ